MAVKTGTAKKDNKVGSPDKKTATRAGGPDLIRSAKDSKVKKPSKGGVRQG
jgi:hypothetical protein